MKLNLRSLKILNYVALNTTACDSVPSFEFETRLLNRVSSTRDFCLIIFLVCKENELLHCVANLKYMFLVPDLMCDFIVFIPIQNPFIRVGIPASELDDGNWSNFSPPSPSSSFPTTNPASPTNKYDEIKPCMRRDFSADNFTDVMLDCLLFVQGVMDSDDNPLNVSWVIIGSWTVRLWTWSRRLSTTSVSRR